jgi:hypothetical protein
LNATSLIASVVGQSTFTILSSFTNMLNVGGAMFIIIRNGRILAKSFAAAALVG